MTDLLARLRAATGPCREWDVWVALEVAGLNASEDVPFYTASVDACLELLRQVLPDHRLILSTDGYEEGVYQDGKARADIEHPISSGGGPDWHEFGATPALALLTAIVAVVEAQRP